MAGALSLPEICQTTVLSLRFLQRIGGPCLFPTAPRSGDSPMILIQKLFDCRMVNNMSSNCSPVKSLFPDPEKGVVLTVSMMSNWNNRYFRFHWFYYIRFLDIFQGVLYWANSKFSVRLFMHLVHYSLRQYTVCQNIFVPIYIKRTLCHEINEKRPYFWRISLMALTA